MFNNLNIKSLSVKIDSTTIRENISLNFKTGDVIAFIGPNGQEKPLY